MSSFAEYPVVLNPTGFTSVKKPLRSVWYMISPAVSTNLRYFFSLLASLLSARSRWAISRFNSSLSLFFRTSWRFWGVRSSRSTRTNLFSIILMDRRVNRPHILPFPISIIPSPTFGFLFAKTSSASACTFLAVDGWGKSAENGASNIFSYSAAYASASLIGNNYVTALVD